MSANILNFIVPFWLFQRIPHLQEINSEKLSCHHVGVYSQMVEE